MHNLSTVIHFEIVRTLKKKSFWIMAIGFPVMMAVIFGISFLSSKATDDAAGNLKNQHFSIEVTDDSKLVNSTLLASVKAKTISTKEQGISDVKNGKVDSYIYYPTDFSKSSIEVFGKNVDIFNNSRYEDVAKYLLTTSVGMNTSQKIKNVLTEKFTVASTTYRDGQVYDPFKEMIIPGVFLVLFYLLIAFFGNQMLTSTIEEKENRVIEMILTTIESRTLIIGKIISLIVLALFQGFVMIAPAIIGYIVFHNQLNMPWIDLSALPLNASRISIAVVIFFASLLLFTGLLVLIGSSVPTAKEAGSFIGIVMLLIFGPLYAVTLFISAPNSPLVTALTLFPLTAPVPLLLRNAVGNLQSWEVAVAIPVLIISAAIVIALAVRTFRYGALEYSRKLSLKEILGKR
jgi:ABC-2 type transport system permease protein